MRLFFLLVLAVGAFIGDIPKAVAGPTLACSSPGSGTVATITLPNVSVSPNVPVGTLLGSYTTTGVTFACSNVTSKYGVVTIQAGNLAALDTTNAIGGGSIKFATNVPGIAVKLTATPNQADAGTNGPGGVPGWELNAKTNTSSSIATSFTVQLIKTGPISPGTVGSINLLQLTNYSYGATDSAPYYVTLVLNPVTVSMNSCSVNVGSANFTVTLPTVSNTAFTGAGTVAGTTPFKLVYSCVTGWTLSMTMNTANPGSSPGVILSTSGGSCTSSATNIGVQLLQGNMQPVTFNSPQAIGASPNGTLTIPYYARYYQTAAPAGPGRVCATATYTMSYQ
jgi:type 1 fimbria pilin